MECLWIIEAANNEVIFLRFLEINIENDIFADEDPCYDYVKVEFWTLFKFLCLIETHFINNAYANRADLL